MVRICSRTEVGERRAVTRWSDELRDEITVFERDGEVVALSSICPHFGGELNVDHDGGEIVCRWHAFRFGAEDGICRSHSLKAKLRSYAVRIENGEVHVVRPQGH